ncbi:hypothetical protein MesoLjLc_29120 [Mesorhizobium sp. L-8-10]|uniref:DUF2239 family protein n=1 Tax=unclassified Mesorhizobium TaxID=325217 RepID=UPI0019259890|nr:MULTISPECIES: DUF2239 family protein [unclassified Mesorhizobium]BCH23174.1 hypothetical protein MesoLjLb_29590 [Mesorhizobium sp. L-8-3]BCH30982.1 hypothetical protein MesoLjLc_29120 [Mesorhizobium sp. L-8-10]
MTDFLSKPCTAFCGVRQIARGALAEVALAVKAHEAGAGGSLVTFDDATGAVIDLDLRGSTTDVVARLAERGRQGGGPEPHAEARGTAGRGRGRPKLGVVAREVTLLPRHWEWLAAQPGGASQALRRLVDLARHADGGRTGARMERERAYRFMAALAGDLPGFEEAVRALFAGDEAAFAARIAMWPGDVKAYASRLAKGAFAEKQ